LAYAKRSDKAEVISQAQKFAAKGMLDKAIAEWQKLISRTQSDGNIYNTIGDLHLKANQTTDALSAYLKAADVFKTAGFEIKSAAIYKKIIKIDPARLDVCEKLADLHAERGLTGNAAEDYLRVAKQYAQREDHGAALSVYQKLSRLDPKNCDIRIKIAETCKKLGLGQQAVEAYDAVRSLYEERNMARQAQAILEQILKIDPKFLPSKGTPGTKAFSESAPSTEEASHSLFPNAMLSPPPEVSLVADHPDENADSAGNADPSVPLTSPAIVHKQPEPEPPQLSAVDRMENLLAAGDWESGQALLEDFSDCPIDRFNYLARWVDNLLARQARSDAYCALRSAIALSEEYASFSSEIQSLMIRYLEVDPDHLSAYPILADYLEKAGNNAEAAGIYSKLIAILRERENDPEAQEYYETLKAKFPDTTEFQTWQAVFEPEFSIDPRESTAPSITTASSAEDPVSDVMKGRPPVADGTIIDERVKAAVPQPLLSPAQKLCTLSDATLKSYLTEAEVYIKYRLYAKAIEHLEMVAGLAPGSVEAHLQLKDLYVKQGDLEKAAVQHLILAQLYDEAGRVEEKEAVLSSLDALDPEGVYHQENGAWGRSERPDVAVEGGADAWQEAVIAEDNHRGNPIVEDRDLPMPDPGTDLETSTTAPIRSGADSNPFIDRISEGFTASILEHLQEAQHSGSVARLGGATKSESVDSTPDEPREALPESSIEAVPLSDLSDITEKMREAEHLAPNYLKTRFDLGVAYREMGLLPDAIHEFEVAIEAGFRLGEAYAMIARCHQENDAFERAEHLLHEGLKDARCTPDERHRLQCEIDGLHRGVKEDQSRAEVEASVSKRDEDDPSPCNGAVAVEKETFPSADSKSSLPAKSGARKKRIVYL